MFKKKYHGALKVLLLLLFSILLGNCSICYANITEDYFLYTIHNLRDNGNLYASLTTQLNNVSDTSLKQAVPLINNVLSTNNLQNLDDKNLIVIPNYSSDYIYLIFSNCSYPNGYDNLGYLKLYGAGMNNANNGYWIYITSNSSDPIYYIQCQIDYSNYNFYVGSLNSRVSGQTLNGNLSKSGINAFSDNLEIFYMQNVSVYNLTQVVYTSYPITSTGNVSSRFIRNYVAYNNSDNNGVFVQPEPEPTATPIPTPTDTPIPTGGTDYTNQLNTIKDTISGEAQSIRDNDDENTQAIIDNQNQNSQTLLSSILSFSGDVIIGQIDSIRDIEFDLGNAVVDYQTKFFNGSPSGDLVFSWNGISLFNTQLIPSGDYNISALIRNDEQLGRLHHLIQIFSISSFGVLLLAGYWNLFLSTIGAGSHFLVETETENDALEDNASIDEFSHGIDEFHRNERRIARDNYYKDLVARVRANELRKAGRK